MTDATVNRRCNPRCSYDEHGREIAPPTMGDARSDGETTAAATCHHSSYRLGCLIDRFPGELQIVAATRGTHSALVALLDLALLHAPPLHMSICPIRTSDDDEGKSSARYRAWSTT
ncbi:hypothetical protein [Methylobacterium nonmethylotrophicum]|uniref:Uncharacterized protein n=1 Tax=Methylobacterium nonmethylotrophicum TaxID=1141884 RepID=A0A4Z0NEU4_9HYPH|nr:hypothetical protein [Methylobacterium nonmethylotrophicum]TGD92502.1 hypothetical protein EU555_34735 [Methylobacterium nonmethylotrophicum]